MPRRLGEPQPLLPEDDDISLTSASENDAWSLDQLARSEFFHQKLHEWGLMEVAYQIEAIKGEALPWETPALGISSRAWDKVIHRGIRPILVFAHPDVLASVPRAVGYYRMLAMVSQKSMNRIGLATARYEDPITLPDIQMAQNVARRLNEIISQLIESDEEIDAREFDMWRGMAAGSQAQGSWQNAKGDVVENLVKVLLRRRVMDRQMAVEAESDDSRLVLNDGRMIVFGDEPDIAVFREAHLLAAVEVKGGIDVAGVLERIGAAIKSLSRVKETNAEASTILILQGVSVTPQAMEDLKTNQRVVNHWMTVEEVLRQDEARGRLFELLGI